MGFPDKLQVFEFMAHWLGGTTAAEVAGILDLKRQYVQETVIKAYKTKFPGAMRVCPSTKRTSFDGEAGALKVSPATMEEILSVTAAMQAWSLAAGTTLPINVPIEDISSYFENETALEHFRTLYEGIARKRSVTLDYQSKATLFSTTFSPHAFVRSSFRTHVRGWSQREQDRPGMFLDLIPARIVRIRISAENAFVDNSGDEEWHRRVTMEARLIDGLPEQARAAVALEYQLGDRPSFKIPNVRAASVRYVAEGILNRRVSRYNGALWTVMVDGKPFTRD